MSTLLKDGLEIVKETADVPVALRRQAEALEALEAEERAAAGQSAQGQTQANAQAEAEGDEAAEAEAARLSQASTEQEQGKPVESAPQQTAAAGSALESAAALRQQLQELEQQNAGLLQHNRLLKGKLDTEIPRYARDLKAARLDNERITALEQKLEQKLAELAQPQDPKTRLGLSDEEANAIGEDLLPVLDKIITRNKTANQQELERKLAELRPKAPEPEPEPEASGDPTWDRFLTDLGKVVPDYAAVDSEPGWQQWLRETDPTLGVTRQELLNEYSGGRNTARAAAMFNSYKAGKARNVQQAAQDRIREQATPALSSTATAPAPKKKTYTKADIDSLCNRVAREGARMTDQERETILNEIDLAEKEGRIQA